jgi:hypothetical protein
MNRLRLAAAVVALGAVVTAPAAAQTRQRDAAHFTNALRDDAKLADTLEGAAESLAAGHEVVILFDGRSVTALRVNPNKANRTPLDDLALREADRRQWADRLHLAPRSAPATYLAVIERLAALGARVFVNRDAVRLYGLRDAEIHPVAAPISSRQMADVLDATDLCYTYGY